MLWLGGWPTEGKDKQDAIADGLGSIEEGLGGSVEPLFGFMLRTVPELPGPGVRVGSGSGFGWTWLQQAGRCADLSFMSGI